MNTRKKTIIYIVALSFFIGADSLLADSINVNLLLSDSTDMSPFSNPKAMQSVTTTSTTDTKSTTATENSSGGRALPSCPQGYVLTNMNTSSQRAFWGQPNACTHYKTSCTYGSCEPFQKCCFGDETKTCDAWGSTMSWVNWSQIPTNTTTNAPGVLTSGTCVKLIPGGWQ